jgi:Putative Ig domain/Fibronectin type III domain
MNSLSVLRVCVCLFAFSVSIPCRLASADAITLEWDPNTAPIEGYKLYVGTQSGTYKEIFNVGPATTFTYTNAIAGQKYCFVVSAYSSPTLESPQSSEVCGYSDAPPVLTNPGNQSSMVGQPTTLQLAATDPDGQAVRYSATGLPPGLSLGASTGFISGSGTTAGNYGVQVTASDGVLTSSQSFTWAMGTSTTPPLLPSSPDSVTLTAAAIDRVYLDRVRLSWTATSRTEVWVYRDGTLIAQTANDGAFTDFIRLASGTHTYQVCVPNATDCSNSMTVTF